MFEELEVVPENIPKPETKLDESKPKYGSPEWNDYVLGLLTEEEKPKGNPTCAGLRRIGEDLLGEIISSGPVQIYPSTNDDGIGRATVVYEIIFAWKMNADGWVDLNNFDYPQKVFRDVGESWKGNTPRPFDIHAAATASTRAEARVWRKALKLAVATAEEMTVPDKNEINTQQESTVASAFQKSFIKNKCAALNIDLDKFILAKLDELEHKEASKLLETLNGWVVNPELIPKEIKL